MGTETVTSNDGTRIGLRISGEGPPLLFVHGTTADYKSWDAISVHLQPHFTVYAMDRRGRGMSGDSPDYTLAREAEDVAAAVASIGTSGFLCGHSFGGLCCLEAVLLTGAIQQLILYEPLIPGAVPTGPEGLGDRLRTLVEEGELEAAMDIFLREEAQIPAPELAAYRRSELYAQRIPLADTIPREMQVERTYVFEPDRFGAIQVPTLFLLGSETAHEEYRRALETLAIAIPESKIVLLEGQGHMAHHENPEMLAKTLMEHLLA